MDGKPDFGNDGLLNGSNVETEGSMDIKIHAEVEKIWINYDLNKDGHLDYDEVKVYLKARCSHIPEDRMQDVFNSMDVNNDG